MTKIEERGEQIVRALTDAFIDEDIKEMSVAELAKRIGASPTQTSYAATHLFKTDHGWRRISPTTVYIDVRERNFNTVTHQRSCRGYFVTREHLASIIRSMR